MMDTIKKNPTPFIFGVVFLVLIIVGIITSL